MTISNQASGIRPGVCTSTTRPTAPYTGQVIYETDTGYLRVWDGSAWDYLSQKQDYTAGLTTGKIVQVVSAQATSGVNNTTNTLADSGLQASITPQSTSNKILVTISQAFMRYGGTNTYTSVAVAILRNSTMIFSQNGFLYTAVGGETLQGQWPYSYLDSPATTSSVTYKTQFCLHPYAGSGTVSAQPSTGSGYSYSSITLCEVVA